MKRAEKYYKIVAILIIAVLATGAALIFVPHKSGIVGEPTEFVIKEGQTLNGTAELLTERDLIISRYLFIAYAVLTGHERDFKAGRYKIIQPVNVAELVSMFSRGLSEPEDISITIPEGSNVADVDRILVQAGIIGGGDFLNGGAVELEGYLFPDTYRFYNFQFPISNFQLNPNDQNSKQRVEEIMNKMRENFEAKILAVDNLSELNSDRLRKVVIIASMLEKEVKTEQDMRLVAGIMEKRLELGMPLEIDATVAYGVCRQKFLLGEYCDVSLANIVDNIPIDSAYNTYKRKGLPAGPISNPGLKALNAAMNPQPSDYLYYLSAKDGTTIFSKTAAEHVRARQKYLQ